MIFRYGGVGGGTPLREKIRLVVVDRFPYISDGIFDSAQTGKIIFVRRKKLIANIWAGHRWSSGGGEGEWVVGPEAPAWELGLSLSAACSNLIVVFELYSFLSICLSCLTWEFVFIAGCSECFALECVVFCIFNEMKTSYATF